MDGSNQPNPLAGGFLTVLKQRRLIVAGDLRATEGNVVMYDRADKVLEIDRHSVMAIAGSPATAWEMSRILEHSFQFYRRSQLQDKLSELFQTQVA